MLRVLTALALASLAVGFGMAMGSEPDQGEAKIAPAAATIDNSQAGEVKFPLNSDNTDIEFQCSKVKPKPLTHVGGFKTFSGSATFNGIDLNTVKIALDIDVTSIFTDTAGLTTHLKSADFFDVKTYPKAKFESTKVEKDGADYKVAGKLTMHGKTKDVTFPAKLAFKDGNLTMSSSFKINRHEWAISYGKGNIIDDVSLKVTIPKPKS
jgi:polyisoprenoid-binding protein YceI